MKKAVAIFCLLLFACHSKEVSDATVVSEKAFFDFDAVDYYRLEIGKKEYFDLLIPPPPPMELRPKNFKDTIDYEKREKKNRFSAIYTSGLSGSLSDTLFFEALSKIKKTKIRIPEKQLDILRNEIFTRKECKHPYMPPSLLPLYVDVFVFFKQGKTVGICKLDLNRNHHVFAGAKQKTECFGQNNEIEKLAKIINTSSFLRELK